MMPRRLGQRGNSLARFVILKIVLRLLARSGRVIRRGVRTAHRGTADEKQRAEDELRAEAEATASRG
jgi:hypothetical protein